MVNLRWLAKNDSNPTVSHAAIGCVYSFLAKMQAQGMQMDSFNLTSNEDLLGKIWP
jgi:hypothetical protein